MKKSIRKEMIQKRKGLSPEAIKDKSHAIYNTLLELDLLNLSNTLVYMDFRNEVATSEILETLIHGTGHVLLPRVEGDNLTIHKVSSLKDMVLSNYGILEPQKDLNLVPYESIDRILAPGVAFDLNCYRLGYGGGFYDRLLSQKRKEVQVIALAFDLQIIDKVPTEPHDFKMDMIITESQVIKPSTE